MSTRAATANAAPLVRGPELQWEIEQFLFDEAAVLDEHRYDDWLALLTEDIRYWVPIRRTTTARETDKAFTKPGDMAFFDDDLADLRMRVAKVSAGNAWSEDPPSRTRHYVSNVRIVDIDGDDVTVELNFILYRTRLESEEDAWHGRRRDTIRRTGDGYRLARRHVFLEQTVILSQNMSNLF